METQTEPLPTAIPAGIVPARVDSATRPVAGSIRARVESPKTAQIEPKPPATLPFGEPNAVPATLIGGGVSSLNCGSIRESCPDRPCATQTRPNPNASPVGVRLSSPMVVTIVR